MNILFQDKIVNGEKEKFVKEKYSIYQLYIFFDYWFLEVSLGSSSKKMRE